MARKHGVSRRVRAFMCTCMPTYNREKGRESILKNQVGKARQLTSAGLFIPLISHFASPEALSFSVTFSTATSLFSLLLMMDMCDGQDACVSAYKR